MKGRLAAELGDKYTLFLMENAEGVPNAVVLPSQMANAAPTSKANEVLLAALFAVATAVTSFSAFGTPLLEWIGSLGSPGNTPISGQDFADALPATLAFWFILGEPQPDQAWQRVVGRPSGQGASRGGQPGVGLGRLCVAALRNA